MSLVRSRLAACIVTGGLAVSGAATVAPAEAASARPADTVHVSVGAASYVRMAARVHPGTHRFVVSSQRDALFQIVRPHRGYTKSEFARDANAGLNRGRPAAIRRFERNVTLVGGVEATAQRRGIMWAHLTPGSYWAVDVDPALVHANKIRTFRVAGAPQTSTAPRADAVVRAIHETDWAPYPTVIPRSGVMSFRNDSEDNHFIGLARLLPGKTVADFKAWIDKAASGEDPGDPPVADEGGIGTGVVSPGGAISLRYAAPAGDYVLVCWWPDAEMGGMPHALMGMYRGITLR